jgi:hypothetical protein
MNMTADRRPIVRVNRMMPSGRSLATYTRVSTKTAFVVCPVMFALPRVVAE